MLLSVCVSAPSVFAQQGCCSHHGGIAYCAANGRYVCADGSYSPSCTCGTYTYQPNTSSSLHWELPEMNGQWNFTANKNRTYDVELSWTPVTGCDGYSVALQKTQGGNPGPLVDTRAEKMVFRNVQSGQYYANIKCQIDGDWTDTRYWEITVPQWKFPSPQPSPFPSPITRTSPPAPSSSDPPLFDNDFQVFAVLGVLAVLGYAFLRFTLKITHAVLKFLNRHDWLWGVIIWGLLLFGPLLWSMLFSESSTPSSQQRTGSSPSSRYSCNCSKTCPNMSCSEAYFQLNTCGCRARDGDGDGVPCEAQCR